MKFLDPRIENQSQLPKILKAIQRVIKRNEFINGPEVRKFERRMALYLGVRHCITTNSGTDSLFLILRALNLEPGDQIITTPFTFKATAQAIWNAGLNLVFTDINRYTFNIDSQQIEDKITENTKAILPVHLFGRMADMKAILKIARRHGLNVIEDVAQALGATQNNKKAGSFGIAGAFSFYPTKNLAGMGDGGLISTNSDELAFRVRKLKEHGFVKSRFPAVKLGINSRMDEIQAAILNVKLTNLKKSLALRKKKAKYYCDNLGLGFNNDSTYNQFTFRMPNRKIENFNFPYKIFYDPPLHLDPAFQSLGYSKGSFPIAEEASKEVISLPLMISEREQNKVIKEILHSLSFDNIKLLKEYSYV